MDQISPQILTPSGRIPALACIGLPFHAAKLLVRTPRLRFAALVPLLVNVLLYVTLMTLVFWFVARWELAWLQSLVPWGLMGSAAGWVASILKWTVVIPILLAACFFTFTTVGMIVAAPFNDLLSSRVEQVIRVVPPEDSGPTFAWAWRVVSTMVGSVRLLVVQILMSLLALPFLAVPFVGFIPLFLVTAYFGGLSMIDVAAARHDPTAGRLGRILAGRRWQVLGLGVGMELFFFIPFAALLVLPVGVTGGTILHGTWQGEATRKG